MNLINVKKKGVIFLQEERSEMKEEICQLHRKVKKNGIKCSNDLIEKENLYLNDLKLVGPVLKKAAKKMSIDEKISFNQALLRVFALYYKAIMAEESDEELLFIFRAKLAMMLAS